MRVLIFTPYMGAYYGGIPKAVHELSTTIGSQGVAVDLITSDANNMEKLTVPLNQWIQEKHYRIRYFSCWHRQDFVMSWSLISWLFNHVSDYDLVHTNTVFAPIVLFVQWICQLRQVPYVMTPHGMLEPWALLYKGWKKRIYYQLFEKKALQHASFIQVIANSEAKHIKALGFHRLVVASNGIHRQEFKDELNPELFYQKFPKTRDKTLILFLGRIDPKKGLDLLAPAFAKIYNKFSHTHLVIAGPDTSGFLQQAKNYFTQTGCIDAVTFTGMVTGELKHAALAAANLYVAPSYSEGFSMSVLEGMASGLPCIITTGCNFPEAAVANVAHIVDINTDAIADALINCLNYPQQAKAMGTRAHEFILQNYTWDCAAEKLVQAYGNIRNNSQIHSTHRKIKLEI